VSSPSDRVRNAGLIRVPPGAEIRLRIAAAARSCPLSAPIRKNLAA
jgi:hypothetical protein